MNIQKKSPAKLSKTPPKLPKSATYNLKLRMGVFFESALQIFQKNYILANKKTVAASDASKRVPLNSIMTKSLLFLIKWGMAESANQMANMTSKKFQLLSVKKIDSLHMKVTPKPAKPWSTFDLLFNFFLHQLLGQPRHYYLITPSIFYFHYTSHVRFWIWKLTQIHYHLKYCQFKT